MITEWPLLVSFAGGPSIPCDEYIALDQLSVHPLVGELMGIPQVRLVFRGDAVTHVPPIPMGATVDLRVTAGGEQRLAGPSKLDACSQDKDDQGHPMMTLRFIPGPE